ncbi:MAG: hypothetical protein ACW99G_03105 [Candidatus Thorarchaeota archaeon]
MAVEDCEGPFELDEDNLVAEVNMWANGKLRKSIANSDTYISLADNIGFEQAMVGDIIIMNQVRLPEHMLVIAFDEQNCLIQVQRGYNGTQASAWKKGTGLRIFRLLDEPAEIELVRGDVIQDDGTTLEDQLTEAFLVYEWSAKSTCTPGCYWLEFKLLKFDDEVVITMMSATPGASIVPSFTPSTLSASDFGCVLGEGVEWCRRFPVCGEGFLIKINNTPTTEIA